MEADVAQLAMPRYGHFELGTGYHGDLWLDLDALFLRPAALRPHVSWLAERLAAHQVGAICGPATGGAFLALALADALDVAFLPAYPAPPPVPGAPPQFRIAPSLLAGIQGWRVAVADDAVNAGTAVLACREMLRGAGAACVAVAALLSLGRAPDVVAAEPAVPFYPVTSVRSQVWPAASCPLCAYGGVLTRPVPA
jgi:orotate phosphoribosyltransferase